ncbi:hypothetical protein HERIO_56 [Hepatospora eriocheir]|uniref:Chromo domain-containing protein n=1 Tax=Hepatospora eriocheir TaxID=1081669 RepID=A0A1X0QEL0_9MICR|nr:hypothetical protein HERIO_56 [Hepatospora eriocheir]
MTQQHVSRIKEVVEFKVSDGKDFIKVIWSDESEGWVKIENVSEKSLIIGFIRKIIENLKSKKDESKRVAAQAKSLELKEKLLMKNSINEKNRINSSSLPTALISIKSTTDKRKIENLQTNHFSSFSSTSSRHVREVSSIAVSKSLSSHELRKRSRYSSGGLHEFAISRGKVGDVFTCQFYTSINFGKLDFVYANCVLVPFKKIMPILCSLRFISKTLRMFLPQSVTSVSQNDLLEHLYTNRKVFMGIKENAVWIVMVVSENNPFIQFEGNEKRELIFQTDNIEYFELFFKTFNNSHLGIDWKSESYKTALFYRASNLFKTLSHWKSQIRFIFLEI